MIIKTEKMKNEGTSRLTGVSKKTGNPYDIPILYCRGVDGLQYRFSLDNEILYEKANNTKDKQIYLIYYLDIYGNIKINDIGE